MPEKTQDAPDSTHPSYVQFLPLWTRMRDFLAGDHAVKARGETYLPRPKAMPRFGSEYDTFLQGSPFLGVTKRTLDALMGSAEANPPTVTAPGIPASELADVTRGGQSVQQFASRVLRERLATGRAVVEVLPASDGRASWRLRPAESLINWRIREQGGIRTVTRAVFSLSSIESDGDWREQAVATIRVLELVSGEGLRVRLFRKDSKGKWQESFSEFPMIRGQRIPFVPVVICGGTGDWMPIEPPLNQIAAINQAHYQASAMLSYAAMKTGLPTPVLTRKGASNDFSQGGEEQGIGPVNLTGGDETTDYKFGFSPIELEEGEKAEMLEYRGAGLMHLAAVVDRYERQMVSLGARLTFDMGPTETATAIALKSAADVSVLVSAARDLDATMTQALEWHSQIRAAGRSTASFESNKDFLTSLKQEVREIQESVREDERERGFPE